MSQPITVYTKSYCPYCARVTKYLKKNKIDFKEIELSTSEAEYAKLKAQTGHQTVPQVFIGNQFIGGSDDFFNYLKKIELKQA